MAGKPKKKNASEHNDTILSDFDDSDFDCDTCGISFNDPKTYKNHLLGKKHSKKVAEEKLKVKNEVSGKVIDSDEDNSDESNDVHCELCDKNFTGYVSYAAHIKGSMHTKNVKKQKLKKQLDDRPEVIKNENGEKDSDDDGFLPKVYARCSTCQKEFGGPESFNMHIKSATHLKKVKQAETILDLKKDKEEHSDGEEIYSKCNICKKSFSGVVPYKIHMQSNLHKKNTEKKKIAEEIKQFCANSDFDEGFVCQECNKTFNDPLAFKCHLQNNSHEKQKSKDALSEFLKSNPEVVYTTPYDKETSEDEDNDDSMFYLICKLCHISFTGPESAQDHVKSKKHISLKKVRKMQKLEKEKRKASSHTTDSNTMDKQPSKEALFNKKQINVSKEGKGSNIDEFELI